MALKEDGLRMPSNGALALAGSAAALAATAVWVDRSAKAAERAHPPRGRFIDASGVRLHFLERGHGSAVVLLHGNGAMAQDFLASGLLEALAERHRVIAFDRPGFGYSERPRSHVWTPMAQAALLRQALRQLGVEQPIVLGHSWGNLVAVAMALDDPAEVRALALTSGYYYPTARVDAPLMAPPAVPLIGDVMRYTISPVLGRLVAPGLIRKMFAPRPVPARFAEGVPMGLALRPWQLRAAAAESAMMIPAAAQLSRRYQELQLPVLIAAGTDDRIATPERQSLRLHRELPTSELMLFPQVGHMLHYAAPQQLADAVSPL